MRRRLATALALAGLFAAASYAAQTLYAGWGYTPIYAAPVVGAPFPFYWRVLLAFFHGFLVAILAYLAVSEEDSARILGWLPLMAPVTILPLAALTVVFS